MAYSRVQKSGWHSPIQKNQSRIVPPPIDIQTQADSLPSSGVVSGIPSKAQRDAIRRSLFEKWAGTGQIQAKLTIGEPGDKYEQEADRVAAQVVNQINAPAPQQSTQSQSVQREAIPEEEDKLMMKPEISTIQRKEELEEKELMQKSEIGTIQREEKPEEEEELQMKPALQLQASEGGMAATDELESTIQQARSGGQPLADNIRGPMEQAFGADFSGVKVHADAQADQLNQSIQAKAFTTGQDVFFRQGEYNPGSRVGQELIAHELTHVVQQNGGVVQRTRINSPLPPSETAQSISDLQRSPFPNRMEEQFGQEVTQANDAAWATGENQLGPGPFAQGTSRFADFINTGEKFKWIFGNKNGLVVISPTLKHSVAAGGGEAITAGHGQRKVKGKIWIDNDTGHYQTTLQSLDLSVPAWKQAGYAVEIRERTDYAAALGNFGGGTQNQCNIM